jgi:hypothetical protein
MHVGRRRDHEVNRATSGLPATFGHGRCEPTPLPSDRCVDRKRIERGFYDAEPLRPPGTFVRIGRDKNPKVKLGERCCADRAFQVPGAGGPDQDGCIEYAAVQENGSPSPAGKRCRSAARLRGAGVSNTPRRLGPPTQRRLGAGPSRATGRPATVIVNSSPASARRRTSETLLRSSFCGMVGTSPR